MVKKTDEKLHPACESKCVWVDAGVVSYKLCTNNYNCSSCQFDHVMLEVVSKEKKNLRIRELKKDRRRYDRRKKEDISWIEESKRLPAS